MKIIFQDYDGVLCNHESIKKGYSERTSPQQDPYGAHPDCVAALNHIIEKTGAVLVVSSTWRLCKNPISSMREILTKWGVKGTVIDVTPDLRDALRGEEILQWLKTYSRYTIESYVILDDNSDMGKLRHRLVQCDQVVGLTMQNAEEAIRLLNGDKHEATKLS